MDSGKTLLIIDDDHFFCDTIGAFLTGRNIEIAAAHSKEEGLRFCTQRRIDVVLLDQKLPDGNGIELCEPILSALDQTKIIFITAFPSFDNAVKALRNGAFDYLSKPFELEEVGMAVDHAFRTLELERVEQVQKYKNRQDHDKNILIGIDGGLSETHKLIELSALNDASVLITGETGTGKSVVAKAIHYFHNPSEKTFVSINCAALPENLIESELFGHEKGAFTGALTTKKGIFEMADGGTLFLDEIGEIPVHLQSKLLGVLDEKKLRRLGGQSMRRVNVRIIAATNINLEEAVRNKQFREDLYYRLSVLRIHVPPLRKRKNDIVPLCNFFLQKKGANSSLELPPSELVSLLKYHWPGNVRELKNILERSIILRKDNKIFPARLLGQGHQPRSREPSPEFTTEEPPTLAEVEKIHIKKILLLKDNNHTRTAEALGISRSTLLRKLKTYHIIPTVSK